MPKVSTRRDSRKNKNKKYSKGANAPFKGLKSFSSEYLSSFSTRKAKLLQERRETRIRMMDMQLHHRLGPSYNQHTL
jgi:hypothetical protein